MSVKFFNNNNFKILLINIDSNNNNELTTLDWNKPNYIQSLTSQSFIIELTASSDTFFPIIKEKLNVSESNLLITNTLNEGNDHNYEMIYIDTLNKISELPINNFATMINVNEEIIKGPVILVKNYVPTLTNNTFFLDMTQNELYKMLYTRGFTKIVLWDDDSEQWREEEVYGPLDDFIKKFFDNEHYIKNEISFLKHNLNILFRKSEYGKENVFGKLISEKVDKILIFTMFTDERRGNITIDEIIKIKELSNILVYPYDLDNKWLEDEHDEYGRLIIKNKYRILDTEFQNSKSSELMIEKKSE
jgi:hypothetical protein